MSTNSSNKQRREEAKHNLDVALKRRNRAEKAQPLSVVMASLAVLVVLIGGIWFAATRTPSTDNSADAAATTTSTQAPEYAALATARQTPLADTVTCTYPAKGEAAKQVKTPQTANVSTKGTVTVTLNTSAGEIPMELDRSVSPCTVNAIVSLASQKYFDNTVCHRLTTQGIHVLQCGDPTGTGTGGPGFEFANEFPTDEADGSSTPVNYQRGTIAMANAGKDTNGSQFFLNYDDSPLPPNYTYFGQISEEGLKTLDKIAEGGVQGGGADGTPAEEVKINSATVAS